jgi:hypothetical protein
MGRRAYSLSAEALEEIRRFRDRGQRRYAVAGAPRSPSYRDIADRLYVLDLTAERVDPRVLWRACRRAGIALPGRRRRS